MTAWCHLPTIFNRRHALLTAGLIALCVAIITTLFFGSISHATTGINQTLSFQGRLLNSTGGLVPDGYYNIQFKLYQDGTGTAAGNPGGTLKWTESHVNNGGNNAVEVKNGYFSVNLGSITPFGTNVDWNQDSLWLSMNIAGSAIACTTFGSSPCTSDGEMLPMKRLTAVPFAINSSQLDGKTASNFLQIAQGVQTDASSNTASIFLNKTSSGNLLQLQNNASDVFTITNGGDLMYGSGDNHALFINTSAADTNGRQLAVSGGTGGSGTGTTGGTLSLQGGNAGGTNGAGGNIQIDAGAKTGTGNDGFISVGATNAGTINIGSSTVALTQNINIGTNNTAGSESNVTIGSGTSATAGTTTIQAKDSITIGNTSGSATVAINGDTTVKTQTDSTDAFNVTTSLNNKVLAVDTANSRVAVGAVGTGSPTLDGSGLQVQGALRLDGGGASGMTDIFTTPVGASVKSKITIPLYDPGESGQIIALGLPNTADPTARVLSLFDARTGVHQPTLGVFSPDENNLIGFSWDGSNDIAAVKNTGDKIALQGGNNNLLVAVNNAGTSNVGIGNNATNGYALDVTGDTNTSGGYLIGGNTTLTNSDLTFSGSSDSTISSASGHALNLNGTGGLTIQTDGVARATFSDAQIQIGDGSGAGAPVLLTVDKAASAPTVTDENATLGSIYYDTTLGKLQCYEADGWGKCSSSPDTYVTISPEYTNAVMNGIGTGTMTTDLCSDALDINDGSSAQPTICGSNETYNFYNWTSPSGSAQTRSIYVTYQLPDNFKDFVAGSTSLMGRTNSSNSSVTYQTYRNNSTSGLTACGSPTSVSTGSQSSWQKATATSTADPADCSFAAGDSIVFKISLSASNNADAYVSNLAFTYSST